MAQELTVHNRTSKGWASPPDLMFLKGFTQQAPVQVQETYITLTHRNYKDVKELKHKVLYKR